MILKRTIALLIATDVDLKKLVADREETVTDSTLEGAAAFVRDVAALANVQVNVGALTAVRAIYIETDREVRLHLGAVDADAVAIKPISEDQTAVAYLETDVAALWVENPSATAVAAVTIITAGTI